MTTRKPVAVAFGRRLAAVSAAQLAVGMLGLAVALRRDHSYHFLFLRGRPDKVRRDAWLMGTAFSAPAVMLTAQGIATVRLLGGDTSGSAELVIGMLGAAMVPGYLGEALVRRRLRPSGYDPLESPLVIAGIGLAGGMTALAVISRRRRSQQSEEVPESRLHPTAAPAASRSSSQ